MLHSETSYVVQRENESMNRTLQMFQEKHRELVHYSMYHLIDYDDEEVMLWILEIKKELLRILIVARLSYAQFLERGDVQQSHITDFWTLYIFSF